MQTAQKSPSLRPFKQRKSLATRQEQVAGIRAKFPNKIPVVVERYSKEKSLPLLDKTKFLVPQELTMTQFLSIIRSRMVLGATEAFYLLVNNKSAVSMSVTMAEIYRDYRDEDGFLYMTYTSQEMFGGAGAPGPGHGAAWGAHPAVLCRSARAWPSHPGADAGRADQPPRLHDGQTDSPASRREQGPPDRKFQPH
ncbi:microtubule-associated proteins 1A/1B light chain 3C [Pteronotus mesoamericanus]|uniref:microtubule-associated proteins 1A/1B light chain 3C n=1 Tax=Pteronotus mesoamericanus TaxID=1884717 RepID=UPI0023ED6195|nr:microtubule-associated proteins 1A/1B light chain 3C [Pteronotus parnellii mesoamericanus]